MSDETELPPFEDDDLSQSLLRAGRADALTPEAKKRIVATLATTATVAGAASLGGAGFTGAKGLALLGKASGALAWAGKGLVLAATLGAVGYVAVEAVYPASSVESTNVAPVRQAATKRSPAVGLPAPASSAHGQLVEPDAQSAPMAVPAAPAAPTTLQTSVAAARAEPRPPLEAPSVMAPAAREADLPPITEPARSEARLPAAAVVAVPAPAGRALSVPAATAPTERGTSGDDIGMRDSASPSPSAPVAVPVPLVPVPPVPVPAVASAIVPPRADTLERETSVLASARRSLRAGNGQAALAELDAFARTFPRSSLAPEAQALRLDALLSAGRRSEAARLAAALLAQNPGGPYAPKLRALAEAAPH